MHKHTVVSHFMVPHGQGNALSTACCGGKFPAAGLLKRGGLGLSVDFENLGVNGFNPVSDTWV